MNTLIKGKELHFTEKHLGVELEDGRIIYTPLTWYRELLKLSIEDLKNYKFICRGSGIEWESIDYQLSIEAMLIGNHNISVA